MDDLAWDLDSLDLDNKKKVRPAKPLVVPRAERAEQHDPTGYLPDKGLVDAMRVALMLRKPLLVTGEPGTGKTDLAYYLSWKLGHTDEQSKWRKPYVYSAKSDSTGRDLFYSFDTVARFRAGNTASDDPFLTFNALGLAILQASGEGAPKAFRLSGKPQQSVVLIDEVDKAPRDFPNDILNELDRMKFSVREIPGYEFEALEGMEPIVVITSNMEKNLPGPFLRRCVYYNIPFPDNPKRISDIVCARVTKLKEARGEQEEMLNSALQLFLELRDPETELQNKPATGVLIDWLLYLVRRGVHLDQSLKKQSSLLKESLSALIKDQQDTEVAAQHVDDWLNRRD